MSFKYSEKLMKHFRNPLHAGEIENSDGVGEVGNRKCGDVMQLFIKVKDNIITDIKFKTLGCCAAIALSDVLCELAINKTLDDALKIEKKDLIKEIEGVPPAKLHCSLLAIDALHNAIEDYKRKKKSQSSFKPS